MVERFFPKGDGDGGGEADHGTRVPLVIRPRGAATAAALTELITNHRHDLRERLAWAGAVLFRGFGANGAADLHRAVRAFSTAPSLSYIGGDTPRKHIQDRVYTSTEAPAGVHIPLHSEMSYLPRHPRHLFFHCVTPAASGGETTLADTRAVLRRLDPAVRERFIEHGVRYVRAHRGRSVAWELVERFASASKSWMEVFETDERAVAEERCRTLDLSYRWLDSGHLITSTVRPATIAHEVTGEPIWFNQAHLFCFSPRWMGRLYYTLSMMAYPRAQTRSHHAEYGDGRAIEAAALNHIHDTLEAETIPCRWQAGDLLIVDNQTCMHGRNPFTGRRHILVAMTD